MFSEIVAEHDLKSAILGHSLKQCRYATSELFTYQFALNSPILHFPRSEYNPAQSGWRGCLAEADEADLCINATNDDNDENINDEHDRELERD